MAQLKDTTVSGNLSVSGTGNIGGPVQLSGDLVLYASSGDSPAITFLRGSSDDNLNDWRIRDSGGSLLIDQRVGGASFGNVFLLNSAGNVTTRKLGASYAGVYTTEALSGNRTWTFPDSTGTVALTNQIPTIPTKVSAFTNDAGYITDADIPEGASAYTGIISPVGTTASNGTSNAFARGDHVHNITGATIIDALGYTPADETDLPEGPLIGNTSDITPTQVLTALQAGRDVYITYTHELYGTIAATYFDYSNAFSVIISNVITMYTDGGQTTYMLFQLSGYLNNNTWGCHVTTLAEKSDVPTVTNSNTTGITASTTATKTTLGTAGSIYGVQSSTASVRGVKTGANSTTTASKVTLGTAFSIPNPSFSNVTVPIRADSDTVVPIKNTSSTTIPIKNANPTSVPVVSSNAEVELSFVMDTTDTKQLNIGWTAKPTRTVFGDSASIYGVQSSTTSVIGVQSTTTSVRGVKTGTSSTTTASKGTLGTAFTVPNITGNTDVTVPIRADSDTVVPIKDASTTSIPNVSVSSATVSITDPGHTHSLL